MTRMMLTAASRLLRHGLDLRLVEQRGDHVDWACDITKQRFTWTHTELADMVATGEATFRTVEPRKHPPAQFDPDDVDPADQAEAERKLAYVRDLHDADLTHRAPLKEFEEQLAKTAERLQDTKTPTAVTAKRWLAKAGDEPTWQALRDLSFRKGNRGIRLDHEQRAIVDRIIDERYLKRARPSLEAMVPLVRHSVNAANAGRPADDRIKHVGRAGIATMIALRPPRDVHALRHGEAAARARFDRVRPQADPEAPLDRIEVDFTPADLFVVSDEDGLPIGRPIIGFATDRCTRMPFGLYIGFEPESVLAIMQVLRNGMFPKTYLDAKIESGKWDIRNGWPAWGLPRTLVFDRGMAAIGHDIRNAALELGIREVLFMAARRGNQQGGIERFLGTLNRTYLQKQRGTAFSNVMERKDYDPRLHAVISFSELQMHIHGWIADVFIQAPHAGMARETPARRWERLIERHPSEPLKAIDQLRHLFTKSKTATIGRSGVRFRNMHYNSDELDAERRTAAFKKAAPKRKVRLRWDPADLGTVWVLMPHRSDYLTVPATDPWIDYATGRSEYEHDTILAHHRLTTNAEYDPDSLAEAHARLARLADESVGRNRKRIAHAKRQARLDGVGRISPAGDDASTTPTGSNHDRRKKSKRPPTPANDAPSPMPTKSRAAAKPGSAKRISMGVKKGGS